MDLELMLGQRPSKQKSGKREKRPEVVNEPYN